MLTRRTVLGALAAGTAAALLPATAAAATGRLKSLVDGSLRPGLVVGAFSGPQRYCTGDGVDARTVHQIGSLTKTVTAHLLADALCRGTIRLSDPLSRHLPADWVLPAPITVGQVATHSSGLPPLPPNIAFSDDPYADYTDADLAEGLRGTGLVAEPGTAYGYSNLGYALLGKAVAPRDYAAAVRRVVTGPLRLRDTTTRLTPEQASRKATGHGPDGVPVPDWRFRAFAPAGALYGTGDDVLDYLRALSGNSPTARLLREPVFAAPGTEDLRIGLAWHHQHLPGGRPFRWHNGMTGGFHSFAALSGGTGVVVLASATPTPEVEEIGVDLLAALTSGH